MTRQISCGHCGGTHTSVAEVRACATTEHGPSDGGGEPLPLPPPEPHQPSERAPERRSRPPTESANGRATGGPRSTSGGSSRRSTPAVALEARAEDLAGPESLGRSLVIPPGGQVPGPWSDAPAITASETADRDTIGRLLRAWRERERVVIEWTGPLPAEETTLTEPFHELSPETELPGEALRFAVTANSIVLLDEKPTFEPISIALALGARLEPPHYGADKPGEMLTGDVTLPGPDQRAWADGGPLSSQIADASGELRIVPRVHLVAGRLAPLVDNPAPPTAELAPDQLAAVGHDGGPARIIAPAGSGKTRVLTERTRHLVVARGIEPAAVSLVAYNRRARDEMAERLADVSGLDIRTLNSLALAIATRSGPFQSGQRRPLTTIGEIDARRLLDRIVPGRRRRQLTDPLEPWIDALSACRLGLRDPDEIESTYGGDVAGFREVLPAYRQELRRRGELDFDEQILTAIETLLTDPTARRVARSAAPILLIDEFQDLTPAHLLLMRLLAGPPAEVVAVGDDDQTIYGYTGAKPEWLVEFNRYFPGAADHPLTVNYRCPPAVVNAAANLLSYNRYRVDKTINPGPSGPATEGGDKAPAGQSPLIINDGDDPQQRLVTHVSGLIDQGATPSDIAVLARVNAALLPPALYLADAGLPVAKPLGVDGSMLDRSGVGAALSWLRLAAGPEQRLRADDLRLALRRPPRSLHPRIADWVCEQRSVKELVALSGRLTKEREANIVSEFANDIEKLRTNADGTMTTVSLLDWIYDDIGLLGAASQLDQSQRTARRAAHSDELAAIRAIAAIGPAADELEGWIRDHLDGLPRANDPEKGDVITLATIHSTKGLEWPHVIVHDVRGDLHPHRLAIDDEEERRIFHVAVTRGRDSVLINSYGPDAGQPRSPFVRELESARPNEPWPEIAKIVDTKNGKTSSRSGPDPKPARAEPSGPEAARRRNALTEWRTARSKVDAVPAYIVLGNATLDEIAESAPTSLVGLGRIKGIGPAKLDRYGADILGVLADAAEG